MPTTRMSGVIHYLRRAVPPRDLSGLTDRQLVEAYINRCEEAALATLVHRHGPMVWGVCRRVLRDHHDAEDAFQATFLVLVRKASSIASPELLANWLYGVARQTALKARATSAKRRARERQVAEMPEPAVTERDLWHDLRPLLDQEVSRLPDKFRVAIVLCELEGKTRKEAARQLDVPEGTLAAWLARGRVMLAKRLARHGLAVSGGSLMAALSQNAVSACAPTSAVVSTIKAATLFAAGRAAAPGLISAKVVALTEGVLRAMFLTQIKFGSALLLGAAVMLGLAVPGMWTFAQQDTGRPAQAAAPASKDKPKAPKAKAGWRVAFELKHEHPVNIVACSADWIAAGDEGGNLFLCDQKTGKDRKLQFKGGKKKGLTTSVDHLQFTPDGKHLFAVLNGRRGMWRLDLDPNSKKPSPGVMGEQLTFLGTSADGEFWLELQDANKRLALRPNVWSRGAAVDTESILYKAEIAHATISADDKWLAVVTADENLRIHDRATLAETQTIPLPKQSVNAVQFSKDGKSVGVVGPNGFAKVYDTESGKEVATLKGHRGIIFCVTFSPDGKTIVTGGDDNAARVWDAAKGKLLAVLEGHKDSIRSVAFDPSGETLLTGSADKSVKAWRLIK